MTQPDPDPRFHKLKRLCAEARANSSDGAAGRLKALALHDEVNRLAAELAARRADIGRQLFGSFNASRAASSYAHVQALPLPAQTRRGPKQ
ncbi:hypothetical protein [Breoghania sp. L-A4]|uniref:hypothetical protein n=1 Tax=Breoghania sp. L-A4 TaxID=2304600 RepID=UPI000E35ACDF|nr:hypothetical protein [Breoghania sp. L-A4]AXS41584.1 hypothetical protein D1F64_18215 [Breoghania sp. L-A4]